MTRTLNRDHDALIAQWTRVPNARSYAVRVESPFGPFFLFTDSTAIRLTGDLRNLFAGDLQRVFIPGFRQDMIVAAVDRTSTTTIGRTTIRSPAPASSVA